MGTCSTPPYGVQGFWQPKCWGTKGNEGVVVSWGRPENYSNTSITDETLDFSLQMSHCHSVCLCLANNSPPPKITYQMWVLHLWRYFGLTFRVSLRLISRFSSISSCSLRAAENEKLSVTPPVQAHANRKMFGNHLKGNKHTICIIWLIRFALNWISFLIS